MWRKLNIVIFLGHCKSNKCQTLHDGSFTHPSYLTNRTQSVSIHYYTSKPAPISFGVPQGSVHGPVLFVLCTAPLSTVFEKHSILHSYTDDSQLQKSALPHQIPDLFLSTQKCIDDIKSWMTLNKLKLNDDKTEAMIVSSGRKSRSVFFSSDTLYL